MISDIECQQKWEREAHIKGVVIIFYFELAEKYDDLVNERSYWHSSCIMNISIVIMVK